MRLSALTNLSGKLLTTIANNRYTLVETTRVHDTDTEQQAQQRAAIREILHRIERDPKSRILFDELHALGQFLDDLGLVADWLDRCCV
jgi:hypothetical protein